MASYLQGPVAPPDADWRSGVSHWRMFGNDTVGCCTRAAQGHAIQSWSASAGFPDAAPSDLAILDAYSAISGYVRGQASTDRGANMLDAMNDWRKRGLDGHRIHGYVKIDAGSRAHVSASISLFGGVYVGAQMPIASRDRDIWIAPARGSEPYRPGSWGGHTFWVPAYTVAGLVAISWGRVFTISWQWWLDYVDEAYAILGAEWADERRPSPSGFDLTSLRRDLARLHRA